jgi:23S rRNA (cytidine2498-2'-O)-methyltransferase
MYAQEEVKRIFPKGRFRILVPTEVLYVEVDLPQDEVIAKIHLQEPVFLRHMQPVHYSEELSQTHDDLDKIITGLNSLKSSIQADSLIAVQVRIQDKSSSDRSAAQIKQACDDWLKENDIGIPVSRGADRIISLYLTPTTLYLGSASPQVQLSDWSGGAIRFKKELNQISRAKFKLLEAEYAFSLDLHKHHKALDIGAAPGGWTSLLLERGLQVTAIDPAALHESLLNHPQLTYLRKNISEVKLRANEFDLLVCDMSFSPKLTVRYLMDVMFALASGGTFIMTVKFMHKKPFQMIRDVVQSLAPHVELVKAKQLFHNREELTMFFLKK